MPPYCVMHQEGEKTCAECSKCSKKAEEKFAKKQAKKEYDSKSRLLSAYSIRMWKDIGIREKRYGNDFLVSMEISGVDTKLPHMEENAKAEPIQAICLLKADDS